jgi:hypothetical protein
VAASFIVVMKGGGADGYISGLNPDADDSQRPHHTSFLSEEKLIRKRNAYPAANRVGNP